MASIKQTNDVFHVTAIVGRMMASWGRRAVSYRAAQMARRSVQNTAIPIAPLPPKMIRQASIKDEVRD